MGAPVAVGLERFEMLRGQTFQRHVHEIHQLAWASSGVVMVDVDDRCWVLPPNLALWIPAGVWHATVALRASVLQGIYLQPDGCPTSWGTPTVVAVSPLARQLIEHLAGEGLSTPARLRAEAVLFDVLSPVDRAAIDLPLPTDPRARQVADLLLADPTDRRSLDQFAAHVRSSPRTLLRLFLAETGLSFNEWRVHARLQAATAYLAEGHPVGLVAKMVGYATPSAFVAAFRRVTGRTPAAYFGRLAVAAPIDGEVTAMASEMIAVDNAG